MDSTTFFNLKLKIYLQQLYGMKTSFVHLQITDTGLVLQTSHVCLKKKKTAYVHDNSVVF